MRVALDATPLLGPRTGVATFTGGLLRALAGRRDVEPAAFSLSGRGWARLPRVLPHGVAAIRRPLPAAIATKAWAAGDWPPFDLVAGTYDVVHGTNYVVPPVRRGGTVVTVYDLTAVKFPDLVEPASLRYPDLVMAAVRRGAFVHVTASAIADEVVEVLGVPRERVRIVASGLDAGGAVGDGRRGRRIACSDTYVLALGTVEPRKGLPDLVAAFDAMHADSGGRGEVGLVIAGPDGWGVDELVDAIDRSPNRARIRRLGWVDERERADLLAGATVFCMPSRYEGFGYPPLEAMASGVPVVATSSGSLPEVLGDAARLVPPFDPEALAGALGAVIADAGERSRMIEAGRLRASTFTWERCAAEMVEVYRDATA